ncbi:MAG: ATP-dependent zinc metalloprotease FtsH [Bdellovibrionota bacterium]
MVQNILKNLALWVLILLVTLAVAYYVKEHAPPRYAIAYSEFLQSVEQDQIKDVEIRGNRIRGRYVDGSREFETYGPTADFRVSEILVQHNVRVTYVEEKESIWWQILISWFPLVLILLLFFFFMRQMQVGGGKAMSFGKSRAHLLTESRNRVTFDDVAGCDEAKQELEEIIAFLRDPKKFTRLGGRIPKGVLLVGPPGTGKTLLAKAVAGEAGVPFFSISGSDFVEMFVGVGASRVRDLFVQGKKHAPCIIFIDEIDAVGRHRGAGLGGGHDEREQTLNQLLVEMDGFESNEGVILVAATNRPDVLDPALLRPGRFDRRVVVAPPDLRGREQILAVHTRKVPLARDVDLQVIARGTPGFSGADLENLVNEAALLAARSNKEAVGMIEFEVAKDKVLMGAERKSHIISEEEKRVTAYHEAGHALVGKFIEGTDPIHKVTIIPRGMALGITQYLPTEDKHTYTRDYIDGKIAILMGGRVAEEILFGGTEKVTTGAGNDIERATELARRMVCEWGMSTKMGPLSYGPVEEELFLGREITRRQEYSSDTAQAIDAEIRSIVMGNYTRARKILDEHLDVLHVLAKYLLERETLDAKEVEAVIRGDRLPDLPPAPPPAPRVEPEKPSAGPKPLGELATT